MTEVRCRLILVTMRKLGNRKLDMAVEVGRFLQRAISHAKIFPEVLSEQCAHQEHHIVDEAGRNQLQVTMEQFAEASRVRAKSEEETRRREHRLAEQVDGLRLQVLQLQALIESQNDEKAPGRRTPPPQCARRRLA